VLSDLSEQSNDVLRLDGDDDDTRAVACSRVVGGGLGTVALA